MASSVSTPFTKSIRFRFMLGVCLLLFGGTCLLSGTMAYHVGHLLQESLLSKGGSLATNIARRNEDALLISGGIRLENVLIELITDPEVAYTTITDNQGKLLTSQFESINYNWPGLHDILPRLSKDSELPDIIAAIQQHGRVRELVVPIMLGNDAMGMVHLGMSEARVREQITSTTIFVVSLNLAIALGLGATLLIASKKFVLDPIVALSEAASRLANGHLSTKVDIKSSGEIQMLVDTFNHMAENLNTTTVSKKYVDNIINSMMDTLVVLAPDKRIVLANPAALRLLGYEERELLGKPVEILFYDGETHCPSLMNEIMAHGFVNNIATAYRTKIGDKVPMLFSGSLMNDASVMGGIACVAIDITEQEKLKEELLKLDKLESVGLLAGGIAHDFNNLLQGVFGYISLAKATADANSEVHDLLESAEKALILSKNLTKQLLTFSKGGQPIKKVVALPALIQESIGFALSGSNIDCRFNMEDPLWPVEVDEGQMSQVMQNMVINAAEAMTAGGTVRIGVRNITNDGEAFPTLKPGRYARITIEDNGQGIAAEHIKKIFDPYYTTKERGSGLGLATAFSIVKQHGGIIEVQSEPGKGSTFFIYLPAAEKGIQAAIQAETSPRQGVGNILVMDDEEMVRAIADRMLRQLGYGVEGAVNGAEALAKYAQAMEAGRAYDAVILDLTIKGGMGGKETIARLVALDPGVRAIVASGYSDDPVMANCQEHGFQAALAKPFTIAELSDTLHKLT